MSAHDSALVQSLLVGFILVISVPKSTLAGADDLAGLYVGGAVGEAHLRSTEDISPGGENYALRFNQARLGWKVFAGVRPISFAGVEVGYADFGRATAPSPFTAASAPYYLNGDDARQSTATVFAVAYLPLPVPYLDLYGKVGAARLHTQEQATYHLLYAFCPVGFACGVAAIQNQWETDFAYGAGVQAKMGAFAVRAEYQRIKVRGGNPDLLSVGALWAF